MSHSPLFTSPPKSLCILRLSAVGDVCHALAVVQHIQRYWPQTKLTWIVGKTEMGLLSGIEGVELVPYDKKSGWKGVWNLWMFLKNNQFDALLNMQTAFRASIISLGIQAKYKIGFGKKRSREGQWLFVNRRVQDPETPHVLDGFMAFADYLGVPPAEMLSWQLAISDSDREYAEVANIAHQHNVNVIFCSSPAKRELDMVKKITALCNFQPVDASGKTSLKQLAALIHQSNLVLSPDSGPAHIATTQGTPVIGLYAYHNPLRTAPYHNLDNVVSVYEKNVQKEQGKPSSELPWATKLKGKNLMAEIQVEQVVAQMRALNLF